MDRQTSFDRILAATYDIADLGAQRRLLGEIAALLDSHCANLAVLRRDELLFGSWHGFPDYPARFLEEAAAIDQWRRSLLEAEGAMSVGVHFGSRHITHRDLARTRFYSDYCKPCGVDYSIAACFLSDRDHLGILAVYRGRQKGDYGARESRWLGDLLPHLARATALAARLQRAELLRSSGERAWDLMATAMLLLGGDGRIMFANRMAEEILGQSDGLAVRHGRLVATAGTAMARLAELLRRASTPGDGPRTAGAMPVMRSGRRPLQLWAMPLPREEARFPALEPAATSCVLLIDPERELVSSTGSLKALYGLTRAEAELVAGLLHGERLEDYADRVKISRNTARTHLRSVFGKTDTSRQAELMRLMAAAPLRLDMDADDRASTPRGDDAVGEDQAR
jgi:DNA-binding CsgD family transcriptional regulator/PAS domain-containing protein